jgi:hypothetical protein
MSMMISMILIFLPELTNIIIPKHPRGKTNEEIYFSHYIIYTSVYISCLL